MTIKPTLIGWILFGISLVLIDRLSSKGHAFIFYTLVLILIFLVTANAGPVLRTAGVTFHK